LGTGYPFAFGPVTAVVINVRKYGLSGYRLAHFVPISGGNTVLVTWQEEPGLLLYAKEQIPPDFSCGHTIQGALACGLNAWLLNSVRAYYNCRHDDLACHSLALFGVVAAVTPFLPVGKLASGVADATRAAAGVGRLAADFAWSERLAEKLGLVDRGGVSEADVTAAQRTTEGASSLGCLLPNLPARCFPAGTLVATAKGGTPIEKLHVGDTVLAEDPSTGKVEQDIAVDRPAPERRQHPARAVQPCVLGGQRA
jgi:hypothetical protein